MGAQERREEEWERWRWGEGETWGDGVCKARNLGKEWGIIVYVFVNVDCVCVSVCVYSIKVYIFMYLCVCECSCLYIGIYYKGMYVIMCV